ncbi:MAG: crossover junction endodeoxyribonuclease RuvC [Deltaproteobacteria bacterium]|nr:crossover junction endodeoxyribonuclease RuvC [Deltaproteobacteria bacterium]
MRVLGIDPGSIRLGYGIVEKAAGNGLVAVTDGVVTLDPAMPFSERLFVISKRLNAVIEEFRPDAVAVESIFFAKNARSASILGHVRGVALLASAVYGLPLFEYTPKTVKLAATGYGNAEKAQMQKMIQLLLKTDAVPKADAADAMAVAICHINHHRPGLDANVGRG